MNKAQRRLYKKPHDVYRVRDSAGALLYVGCSINAFKRVKQHKNEYQPWFPLASTVDIVQYQDLRTARYIEAHAIATEAPIWNAAQEAAALRRGAGLEAAEIERFERIPIKDFWVNA